MALIQINKNPSPRDLRVFSWILPVFFGLFGALRWHSGAHTLATWLWAFGAVLSVVALAVRPARRWIYIGWMYATYPIGWVVSHVMLAVMYFGFATPVSLLLKMAGRDPMQRRFDKAARSYWVLRQPERDTSRYFRQF
jgi:hypothetical protein